MSIAGGFVLMLIVDAIFSHDDEHKAHKPDLKNTDDFKSINET
jgi:hypothetical protein